MLDTAYDIADCATVKVNSDRRNSVTVRLHHDPTFYPLSHLLVGDLPDGYQVDHIDRNILNNSRCNLRIVTIQQNLLKRYVPNSTGFAGVTARCDKYRASVY